MSIFHGTKATYTYNNVYTVYIMSNNNKNTIIYYLLFKSIHFIILNNFFLCCKSRFPVIDNSVNVYNCKQVTSGDKNNCEKENNKVLMWKIKPYARMTFDSDVRDLVDSVEDCRTRCENNKYCTQITYDNDKYCWRGINATLRVDSNYDSAVLFCCQEYDIPVDLASLSHCELVTSKEKVPCRNSKNRVLAWQTHMFLTFSSSRKNYGTPDECRKLCAQDENCDRVTYNDRKDCWFSSHEYNGMIYNEIGYHSSLLYCCREERDIAVDKKHKYQCDIVNNSKKLCETMENRFLVWESYTLSFNSEKKYEISYDKCKLGCESEEKCYKFTYEQNLKYCLLGENEPAFYNNNSLNNFTTSVLHCCQDDATEKIFINKHPKYDLINCQPAPEVKEDCLKNKNKTLVWKSQLSMTFNSSLKIQATRRNCRRRCENKPNCKQFTYDDDKNECWLSNSYENTFIDKRFNTTILQCCEKEIPSIESRGYCKNLTGSELERKKCDFDKTKFLAWLKLYNNITIMSNRKIQSSFKNCKRMCAYDSNCSQISYSEKNNECFLSTSETPSYKDFYDVYALYCCPNKECPKELNNNEFMIRLTCKEIRKYAAEWLVSKIVVDIGDMKMCFFDFDFICMQHGDQSVRMSKSCDEEND